VDELIRRFIAVVVLQILQTANELKYLNTAIKAGKYLLLFFENTEYLVLCHDFSLSKGDSFMPTVHPLYY
jgi:hypothetical protein